MTDVCAIEPWANNAELIKRVSELGYLDGRVLDLTYGLGRFWTLWAPSELVTNDLNPAKGDHSHDYRSPPPAHWERAFDAVVFDPPYRMSGKRDKGAFDAQYGLDGVADRDVPFHLAAGVVHGALCLAKGGRLLVKCQDQQWSGRLAEQTDWVRQAGRAVGLRVAGRFHLEHSLRPQPPGRVQRSERSNYSTLMVLTR